MKYLVTGAAGFIASQVCRLLLDAGHEVVGVDNLNTAYDPRLKQWRLARLTPEPRFQFEEFDICDFATAEKLFASHSQDGAPFAAVLNLAARAGVRPSVANPWIYFATNAD